MNKRHNAFTLVELLVVLAIISLLAAILFPAFNRAKENARQTNCQSNLQQIHTAVKLYRQDENRYPASLLHLLAEGAKYEPSIPVVSPNPYPTLGPNAPGYYKGGQDTLVCQSDDALSDKPRSSYSALTQGSPTTALPPGQVTPAFTGDLSQYVWNYWGTRPDGFTFISPNEAAADTPSGSKLLVVPTDAANVAQSFAYPQLGVGTGRINVLKYSLANRFAPESTIVTHCIHHRLQTANDLATAGELYTTPANDANVKDIVLRLDGSAKPLDVSVWKTAITTPDTNPWQTQTR